MAYPDDEYPTIPSIPRPKTTLTTGDMVLVDRDWYETISSYIEDITSAIQKLPSYLTLSMKAADPTDPADGESVIWMSDGTDTGEKGEIFVKLNDGGVIKTAIIAQLKVIASGATIPAASSSVENTLLASYTP